MMRLIIYSLFTCLILISACNSRKERYEVDNNGININSKELKIQIAKDSLNVDYMKGVDLRYQQEYMPDIKITDLSKAARSGKLIDFEQNITGWYVLKNGDKALVFVKKDHEAVYIPTSNDFVLLLGTDNAAFLIEKLNQQWNQ